MGTLLQSGNGGLMSGSWEILAEAEKMKSSVFMAILTRETVSTAWASNFKKLALPDGSGWTFIHGMPFDHARNTAVEQFLNSNFGYLFFLDDDVIPPPDVINRLCSHNIDIVSGLYFRRSQPVNLPVMLKKDEQGIAQFINQFEYEEKPTSGRLVEVDFTGAGCLLIKRELFSKIRQPKNNKYFEWRCDRLDLPFPQRLSEDYSFMEDIRQQGHKIFVDVNCRCEHVGLASASIDGFGPATIR